MWRGEMTEMGWETIIYIASESASIASASRLSESIKQKRKKKLRRLRDANSSTTTTLDAFGEFSITRHERNVKDKIGDSMQVEPRFSPTRPFIHVNNDYRDSLEFRNRPFTILNRGHKLNFRPEPTSFEPRSSKTCLFVVVPSSQDDDEQRR